MEEQRLVSANRAKGRWRLACRMLESGFVPQSPIGFSVEAPPPVPTDFAEGFELPSRNSNRLLFVLNGHERDSRNFTKTSAKKL